MYALFAYVLCTVILLSNVVCLVNCFVASLFEKHSSNAYPPMPLGLKINYNKYRLQDQHALLMLTWLQKRNE